MDSRLIETFLASADQGSFAKAGDILSLTPSNVMRQVNLLEKEVGIALLVRSTKGVILTEAGRVFYQESKNLLRLSSIAMARARSAADSEKKRIRLGISAMNPMGEFNRIWRLAPRHNEFALSLINLPTDVNYVVSAEQGDFQETDVAFCSGPIIDRFGDINFFLLREYPLTCAVPVDHPLAQKEMIALSDLQGEKLLFPARGNGGLCRDFHRYLVSQDLAIDLEIPQVFYDQNIFNYCAEHGLFLVSLPCWDEVHPGLINLPVDWGKDWSIAYGLIWRDVKAGMVSDFIKALEEGMLLKDDH